MKKTKSSAPRDQILGPIVIVVIGLIIVAAIGYFGRSAKRSPTTVISPPTQAPSARPDRPREADRPRPRSSPSEAPPSDVVINIERNHFKGEKSARLTLVEFSDYQCPYCARHVRETVPQLEREYVKTGKVKYVFSDFPLESIHPLAFKAAEAANCAGEQGKFWEMHDRLYANQKALKPEDLTRHAEALGLNPSKFKKCLDSGKFAEKIRSDLAAGQKVGARGTPCFALGFTEPNSTNVKIVRILRGAQPYRAFKEVIDNLLASQRQ